MAFHASQACSQEHTESTHDAQGSQAHQLALGEVAAGATWQAAQSHQLQLLVEAWESGLMRPLLPALLLPAWPP